MKKNIFMLLFSILLISFGGCKTKMDKVLDGKEGLFAVIETDSGNIALELFYKQTPLTVTNFVGLAEGTLDAAKGNPFYDGLKFHRVISKANGDPQDFMIQGGDPKGNGTGGPGYRFADEIVDELTFSKPGLLAMANAGPGTNGSQFFITIVPTQWLTGKHTIFGQVVDSESQNVVNKLKANTVIKKVSIYRLGDEAKAFTATQADFDRLQEEVGAKEKAAKEKYLKDQIAIINKDYPNAKQDSNGIYYIVEKEGSGDKTGKKKKVSTNYTGKFLSGEIFDSSIGREPLDFVTGAGQMIPGFDLMVQDMCVGEKRTVILPPEYGYGEQGYPGVIPGNAYLIFEIELISAK